MHLLLPFQFDVDSCLPPELPSRHAPEQWVQFLNPPYPHLTSYQFYAFSRDNGFPDRGFFGKVNSKTKTPLNAVWLTVLLSILPGLLDFASPVAASAIFALTAVGTLILVTSDRGADITNSQLWTCHTLFLSRAGESIGITPR